MGQGFNALPLSLRFNGPSHNGEGEEWLNALKHKQKRINADC